MNAATVTLIVRQLRDPLRYATKDPICAQAADEIERLQGALTQEHAGRLVPGVMHCAKCQFQLIRTNLYVNSGTTGPGDSKTEPCPNGCGPLWPVTWKDYATDAWKRCEEQLDRAVKAETELTEIRATAAKLREGRGA